MKRLIFVLIASVSIVACGGSGASLPGGNAEEVASSSLSTPVSGTIQKDGVGALPFTLNYAVVKHVMRGEMFFGNPAQQEWYVLIFTTGPISCLTNFSTAATQPGLNLGFFSTHLDVNMSDFVTWRENINSPTNPSGFYQTNYGVSFVTLDSVSGVNVAGRLNYTWNGSSIVGDFIAPYCP